MERSAKKYQLKMVGVRLVREKRFIAIHPYHSQDTQFKLFRNFWIILIKRHSESYAFLDAVRLTI